LSWPSAHVPGFVEALKWSLAHVSDFVIVGLKTANAIRPHTKLINITTKNSMQKQMV